MSPKTLCRTCLASNIRMHDMWNTQLQQIFEKLTGTKLYASDGRSGVCYICYSQLQKCSRFLDMALKADIMFKKVLSKEVELTGQSVGALKATNSFILTPVDSMSLPEHVEFIGTIKMEPADVKEEFLEEHDGGLFEAAVKVEVSSPEASDFITIYEPHIPFQTTEAATEKPHTCNMCYKTFKTKYNCKRHILKVHNRNNRNKSYNKVCGKQFTQPQTHKEHNKIRMDTERQCDTHTEENMTCEVCGKTFDIKRVYQNHMRSHTKPYACHVCKKTFSELSSLKKHVASHSSLKPFVCGTCNKGFTHKTFLVVHLRTHTGERPFTCNLCPKTFSQIAHAISHKRTHSKQPSGLPVRPFKCTVCENCYTLRSTLYKHMRIHTGERPYACGVCKKTFSLLDTAKSHRRTHSGEKPFACPECGKTFSTSGNRSKHLKTHERQEDSLKM